LQTLAQDLPESIDLLLLDGAKGLYADILSLVEERLRVGALIVADNAEWSPDYLARVRSPDQGYMSVPFAEDVELSMRVAASPKGTARRENRQPTTRRSLIAFAV
jgi:predicted O-methyltransferase YrrM